MSSGCRTVSSGVERCRAVSRCRVWHLDTDERGSRTTHAGHGCVPPPNSLPIPWSCPIGCNGPVYITTSPTGADSGCSIATGVIVPREVVDSHSSVLSPGCQAVRCCQVVLLGCCQALTLTSHTYDTIKMRKPQPVRE